MALEELNVAFERPENLRIVSRADFDGVASAVLLRDIFGNDIPTIWERPEHIQHHTADIQSGDILANLPYDERALLWFDHHFTNRPDGFFRGAFRVAPSAARVIFEYYDGNFSRDFTDLVYHADKIDAAILTLDEISAPERYNELFLAMTISDREKQDVPYWNHIVDLLCEMPVAEAIKDPQIAARFNEVYAMQQQQKDLLKDIARLDKNTIVCDFRGTKAFRYENRFLPYTFYPEAYASVKISYPHGDNHDITSVNAGYSLLNQNCKVNMGVLLSNFGGGGHQAAAACRFPSEKTEIYVPIIIDIINKNKELPEGFKVDLPA